MRSASYIAAEKEKNVTFDSHIYSRENKWIEWEKREREREREREGKGKEKMYVDFLSRCVLNCIGDYLNSANRELSKVGDKVLQARTQLNFFLARSRQRSLSRRSSDHLQNASLNRSRFWSGKERKRERKREREREGMYINIIIIYNN